MKNKKIVIFIGLFFICCSTSKKNISVINNGIEYTSIISIISNPQQFHNKDISVDGYFILKNEGNAVYLTKTDYENGLFKNSIYLYITYEEMKQFDIEPPFKGYVNIVGKYNMNNKGSYDFFSGSIGEVKNIKRLYKVDGEGEEYNMN